MGLTTYDAKDPDTKFPPIRQLRPPAGAPNVLIVLIDDVGYGASSAFGGPCYTPNFEKLAANGLKFTRFHTDGALFAYPSGYVDRPQPSFGRHGRHHRNCDLGARLQLDPAEHLLAPGANPQAQRLLDLAIRQMP